VIGHFCGGDIRYLTNSGVVAYSLSSVASSRIQCVCDRSGHVTSFRKFQLIERSLHVAALS